MLPRIPASAMSNVLVKALEQKLIHEEDTAVVFYSLSQIKARIESMNQAFPREHTLQAVAIKANPLIKIIKDTLKPVGAGIEVASMGELYVALNAGLEPSKIVFDSPAKTFAEIEYSIKKGIHLNIDNFQELERVVQILEKKKGKPKGTFGLRINPQVGRGKIADTSVADKYSKFGVPIEDRDKIIATYRKYPWLTGAHQHVGSQGCEVDMLADGIAKVFGLVKEINAQTDGQIKIFDIGGGMPVAYQDSDNAPTMKEYADKIRSRCPELFEGKFKIITEFGRYANANTGWTISKVEYVKEGEKLNTAMIHLGGDLFIRKCLQPQNWHFDISVADKDGRLKQGQTFLYNIAGPLCFAGDIIATEILLPKVEPGDFVLIHDTGAYTVSSWSHYDSRQMPLILGYEGDENPQFSILKKRETLKHVLSFWK